MADTEQMLGDDTQSGNTTSFPTVGATSGEDPEIVRYAPEGHEMPQGEPQNLDPSAQGGGSQSGPDSGSEGSA